MITIDYIGRGGVTKIPKSDYVILEQPLIVLYIRFILRPFALWRVCSVLRLFGTDEQFIDCQEMMLFTI